jgi:hypothetical protein
MDARRPVEFTGVELAAPVEKGVAGPVVKALVDYPGGKGHGGREAQLRDRKPNGEGGRQTARVIKFRTQSGRILHSFFL